MAKEKEKNEKATAAEKTSSREGTLIAKKDFRIVHNEVDISIRVGDDLSEVPQMYLANLRTEGVI